MSFKIIACDLDRTLLDSKGKISDRNIRAVKELYKRGVFFVPASGRTMSEMPKVLKDLEGIRYFIHSNGAAVFDSVTKKSILSCIKRPVSCKVYEILKEYDTHIVFRHGGECFADSHFQTEAHFEYYNVCHEHAGVIKDFAVYLDSLDTALESFDDIEVFSAFFHNLDEQRACAERLDALGLGWAFAHYANIEIFNKEAGKGNALKALCNAAGIDIADSIAVGDSDNDLSMIEMSGLGLAVSNATENVRARADKIVCSNDEHVIEYILENIVED